MKQKSKITAIQKRTQKRNKYYVQLNARKDRSYPQEILRGGIHGIVIVLFLFVAAVFGLALYRFMMTDEVFMVHNIHIQNNVVVSEKEILDTVKLYTGRNIFDIDIAGCCEQLLTFPDIKNVTISKELPDTITIRVYERTPLLQFYSGGYFFVDEEGIVLARIASRPDPSLPVVQGVEMPEVNFGKPVENEAIHLAIKAVKAYQDSNVRNALPIRMIDMSNPDDVVIETVDESEIHFGNNELPYRFMKLQHILAHLRQRRMLFSKIDLRFENVPVVMRD